MGWSLGISLAFSRKTVFGASTFASTITKGMVHQKNKKKKTPFSTVIMQFQKRLSSEINYFICLSLNGSDLL